MLPSSPYTMLMLSKTTSPNELLFKIDFFSAIAALLQRTRNEQKKKQELTSTKLRLLSFSEMKFFYLILFNPNLTMSLHELIYFIKFRGSKDDSSLFMRKYI